MENKKLFPIQAILMIVIFFVVQVTLVLNCLSKNQSFHYYLNGEKDNNTWHLSVISDSIPLQKDLSIYNDSKDTITCTIIPESYELQILPVGAIKIDSFQTIHRTLQWNPINKEMGIKRGKLVIKSEKETIKIDYDYWFEPKDFSISVSMKDMTVKMNDKYVIKENGDYYLLSGENYIENKRMYVNARFFIDFLGFRIIDGFNSTDKSVLLERKGKKYYFKYLADKILIDGVPMKTHKLHIIHRSRMFLPIRLMADLAGYAITWDPKDQRVTLYHHH